MAAPHVCFADRPQYCERYAGQSGNAGEEVSIGGSNNSSNVSPIPRYERNLGFFRQLSRRFGLRASADPVYCNAEDDAHSSSTDSCSSAAPMTPLQRSNGCRTNSMELISCASSESGSTVDADDRQQQQQEQQQRQESNDLARERKSVSRSSFSRLQRRSTSSIRRAFESFSLSSRSLSCTGATAPIPTQHAANIHSNGTPIKSALKSSSTNELNKRSASLYNYHTSAGGGHGRTRSSSHGQTQTLSHANGNANSNGNSNSNSNNSKSSFKSNKSVKSKPPPQRILRQPVSYTYLKGISGLPTQRVPRSSVCCQYARR